MGPEEEKAIPLSKEHLQDLNRKASDCLMTNFVGLAAGTAGGIHFGIRRRNLVNFVLFVGVGALADYAYGYTVNCKGLINDYEAAKKLSLESEETK